MKPNTTIVNRSEEHTSDLQSDVCSSDLFPEMDQGRSSELDQSASGNYLVARLNHHIQPNASFSSLNLVRDSYGYAKITPSNNQTTQVEPTYESNRKKQRRLRANQFK